MKIFILIVVLCFLSAYIWTKKSVVNAPLYEHVNPVVYPALLIPEALPPLPPESDKK